MYVIADPKELEVLFDEGELREAIKGIPDQEVRKECTLCLERLKILLNEERQEVRERHEASLVECSPHIQELEAMFAPFIVEEILRALNAIKTEREALHSQERASAKAALGPILNALGFLRDKTNITDEEYRKLDGKYKKLSRAVGILSRGTVDHDR